MTAAGADVVKCHLGLTTGGHIGGPVPEPDDARYLLARCDVHGFYGASSMERLPTERAIVAQTREFTQITLPPPPIR